ncbi:MAG: metallophosphoesterase [Clostridia bacterium]|nr:metallophosphoesterase [Clostridia bacterium]
MNKTPLKITVLTDTHYYSLKSGSSGKAYETASAKSQKLLAGSGEVLSTAFDQIVADKESNIVLISGDLTNNGELTAHEEFIAMLRDLKAKGKRVYVITATHDFRNHGTTDAYDGDNVITTPTATRDMLYDMYREFGPDEAIAVHRQSMSYIVQLCDGYRLFALNDDSNLNGKSGFSDECFEWIKEQAEAARNDSQFILAMTHHPLIAPSPIYEIIGKGDMLGDYDKRLYQLADIGIQFIFTGHTHIHNISADISKKGNVIYDICSGTTIGYPGVIRQILINPENGTVTASTDFVNEPENYKKSGKSLKNIFENQLIGTIRGMILAAGTSIDDLAKMATAISIKPKVIYKFGWIIKPVFKFLNSLKVGTVAKWTKKETGLHPQDYADIKNKNVVDIITELVLNLYGGESKYPPETPTYKITMGLFSIIDSILKTLNIDFKKILKVVPDASTLVEPLLYNGKIDSYEAVLKIYPFVAEGESGNKLVFDPKPSTVKKSKKGPGIIIISVLLLLATLPLWLIIILVAFLINQIKYGKKIK